MNNKVKVWSMSNSEPTQKKAATTFYIEVPDEDVDVIIEMIQKYFEKKKK